MFKDMGKNMYKCLKTCEKHVQMFKDMQKHVQMFKDMQIDGERGTHGR